MLEVLQPIAAKPETTVQDTMLIFVSTKPLDICVAKGPGYPKHDLSLL